MTELLWRQDGGSPRALGTVERDETGFAWTSVASNLDAQLALKLVAAPYPEGFDPATEVATWNPTTESYDISAREIPFEPVRVTKADFRRLLTQAEQALVEVRSKEIDAMTPTAFAADPAAQAFRVMTKAFDEPLEFIELNHGDTIFSVTYIMAPQLPLAEGRVERILAGLPPL